MNKFILAFLLIVSVAFGGATDTPKVFFVGGGGSVKPAATNAVLEAAMAYTDTAITNAIFYVDWEMGSGLTADSITWLSPNSPTNQVLTTSTPIFRVSSDSSVKAQPLFECYSPSDTPVYVASSTEAEGQLYNLVFTCSSVGVPINFKLVITLMPTEGVSGTASRIVIFNLRRTF